MMKSDFPLVILHLPKFIRLFKKLPIAIQELAEERENIFRSNPYDSRLKTHKLHGALAGFWAFYVNYEYRIIFDFVGQNTARFYSIGNHNIYE